MRTDDLVEVFRAPRPHADIVAGLLRSHGIAVAISTDDMAGIHPDIGFTRGARLLVRADDAADARLIIEGDERMAADDRSAP